jgi:hypothetical protein
VPVLCAGKRITILACIATDGPFLKPTIIIPRKTVGDDLVLTDLTPRKVTVRSQAKGHVDTDIFESWLAETFLTEFLRRRELHHYDARQFQSSVRKS